MLTLYQTRVEAQGAIVATKEPLFERSKLGKLAALRIFPYANTERSIMKIKSLQKLTLLDFPNKTACTVFTFGCNLRCPFCHNARLVLGERAVAPSADEYDDFVSEDEFFAFLQKRKGLLDGVCITGGEPLLQSEIKVFIEKIKALGYLVKLDTNGFYPDKLRELISAGLVDYIAMDIKSAPETYALATGIANPDMRAVKESVEIIKNSGVEHEFRTTLVKGLHSAEDLASVGDWLAGEKNYYLQMFVDSGELVGDPLQTKEFSAFSKTELEQLTAGLKGKVEFSVRGI